METRFGAVEDQGRDLALRRERDVLVPFSGDKRHGVGVGIEAGADEKNLAAGDTIASTQSAVVLENLISQFLFSKAADSSSGPGSTASTSPSGDC